MADNIDNVNTTPTLKLTEVESLEVSELAAKLENFRKHGYMDANAASKLLEAIAAIANLVSKFI